MSVRGSVIVRRIGVSPMVVIQAGTRTFRKKGTSYTPSSIAVRAEARNVKDAAYEWGNLVDGVFVLRTDWTGASITVTPARAGVVMVKVRGSNFEGEVTDYVDISVVEDGADGKPGEDGKPGQDGEDGRGVESVRTQYYLSTSKTTTAGGSWSDTKPEWVKGKYLWTRLVTTYTDGTVEYSNAVYDSLNDANDYTDDEVGGIEVGTVNLVSRKMMLAWNDIKDGTTLWGQDSDGVYLRLNQSFLVNNVAGGNTRKDIFLGEENYKAGKQYVISVEWKQENPSGMDGIIFRAYYTDGTSDELALPAYTSVRTRADLVMAKGKTVQKISASYGTSSGSTLIYAFSLLEGNRQPTTIPVHTDDLVPGSVNYVGRREATATNTYATLPLSMIKPNTPYTLCISSAEVTAEDVEPPVSFAVAVKLPGGASVGANISVGIKDTRMTAVFITDNDFTAQACNLLLYAGDPAGVSGVSIHFTDVMMVEGLIAPPGFIPSADEISYAEQTRDDFAEKLGYGSWEEMVAAVAEHGSIIQGDYIRAELIDTNAIATDAAFIADLTGETAFINAISGTSFDFKQGKVGGFTIAAGKLYAGADFGAGAGVRMQSLADDMGFKVYRNASNYVDMFYKDANNWGIRGVRNGAQYFALGLLEGADNNQIGGFSFDEARMKGSNLTLTGKMIHYEYDDGEGVNHVYIGSHSDMALGGATKLGTFVLGNYVFDALSANYYAPLNSNDSYALLCSCITTTHTAAGGYYAFYANGDALFKGMSFVRQFNISASSDKSITLGRSHTLVVITEGSGTITLQATEDLRRQSVYKNIAHFYTFINAGNGEPKLAGLAGGTGDARRVLWFRNQSCKVVMYYNGYFYGHTDYDG